MISSSASDLAGELNL